MNAKPLNALCIWGSGDSREFLLFSCIFYILPFTITVTLNYLCYVFHNERGLA